MEVKKGAINAIVKINSNVERSSQYLNNCIDDIKIMNPAEYNKLKEKLNNLEKTIKIEDDMLPFKDVIINVYKAFLISQTKINVGDLTLDSMIDELDAKDNDIENLKEYIIKIEKILNENDIEIPIFKPLQYSSTVYSKDSISRREKIVKLNLRNNNGSINEWLSKRYKNVENIHTDIPKYVMKQASKEEKIPIAIKSDETNTIKVKRNFK